MATQQAKSTQQASNLRKRGASTPARSRQTPPRPSVNHVAVLGYN